MSINPELPIASRSKRFAALFLDGWVVFFALFLFVYLKRFSFFAVIRPNWDNATGFLIWVYRVTFHAKWGQTIGKMILHTRVVNFRGGKIGAREAILREIVHLSFIFLYVVIVTTFLAKTN